MKISILTKVMVGMALLCISAPAAISDDDDRRWRNDNNRRQGYRYSDRHYRSDNNWNRNHYTNQATRNWQQRQIRIANRNNNSWNWDQHNWNDQRARLRQNWRRRDRISAVQQQQLDAQMRQQWLQYHNNNWNGNYSWDQYSNPQFLDYVHTRNPSLITSLRNSFGF